MLNVSLTVKVVVLIEAVVPAKLMVLLTVWVLASEVNVPLDTDSDVDCNVVPLRIVVEAVMSSVDAAKAVSLHSSRESPDMVRPPGRLNVPFKALSVDCEARLVALVTVRLLPSPTSTCPDACASGVGARAGRGTDATPTRKGRRARRPRTATSRCTGHAPQAELSLRGKERVRDTNRNERSRGRSLLHGQDRRKTQNRRTRIEQWLSLLGQLVGFQGADHSTAPSTDPALDHGYWRPSLWEDRPQEYLRRVCGTDILC